MTAKRVRFDEELNDVNEIPNSRQFKKYKNNGLDDNESVDETPDRQKKHTLDSDEEDEIDKYQQYDVTKVIFFNVLISNLFYS